MITKKQIVDNVADEQWLFKEPIIKSDRDKRLMMSIMGDYFKLMWKALIRGYEWKITRFGIFRIIKDEIISESQRKPVGRYYKGEKLMLNKRLFNKNNIDTIYRIELESVYLDKYKCRFRAGKAFRMAVNKQLIKQGRLQ